MSAVISTGRSLSFALISDNCHVLLQCTLHQLQLAEILLKNLQTFVFCWKLAVATTTLNFEHIFFCCAIFFCSVFSCTISAAAPLLDHGPTSDPVLILYQVFNPVQLALFVHVVLTTEKNFLFGQKSLFHFPCADFAYSGCPVCLILGRPFDPLNFTHSFCFFKHGPN